MTISANPTPDFQRDQILTAAIRLCGLLPDGAIPTQEQIAQANVHLSFALDELQSEGVVLTSAIRTTLALVANQSDYPLDSDTIDVEVGPDDVIGSIVNASGAVESIVKTMSRDEWQKIAVKSTVTARPSRCFIDKVAPITAVFWPIPDSSTTSFRYTKIRLLRGGDTGANTMELKRTWAPYLAYAVAVGVCFDTSQVEKASLFKQFADDKRNKCKAGDVQHGNIHFRMNHKGRNW